MENPDHGSGEFLLDPKTCDIMALITSIVPGEAETWLRARNPRLGGRAPQELIDENRDNEVRELLIQMIHGMPS